MFNGLDNFLNLGINRRCLVIAFATVAFSLFSQDYHGDLAQIYSMLDTIDDGINDTHLSVISNGQRLTNIQNDTRTIKEEFISFEDQYLNFNNDYVSILSTISQYVGVVSQSLHYRDVRQSQYEYNVTNTLNDISTGLANLSLYITNNPNTVIASSWVTNFPFANRFAWSDVRLMYDLYLPIEFYYLYGREPDLDEKEAIFNSWLYGNGLYQFNDWFSWIEPEEYLDGVESYWGYSVLDTYFEQSQYVDLEVESFAKMRYLEYGTHDLTLYASNIVDILSSGLDFTPSVVDVTNSEGTSRELDSESSTTIQNLSDTLAETFSVDDSIADINTNDISNVEDVGYSSFLQDITTDTVIEDVLHEISSELSGSLESASAWFPTRTASTWTMSFGYFSLFGSERKEITFTFSRPGNLYFQLQSLFFGVLKLCCFLASCYSIFSRVQQGA